MLGEGQLAPHPPDGGSAAEQRARLLVAGPAVVYTVLLGGTRLIGGTQLVDVSPNVREMLGLDESWMPAPDVNLISWVHPDDRRHLLHGIAAARRHGSWINEYRMRDARGRWLWVRDHLHLVRDDRGQPSAVSGVVIDITEQRSLELTLRREHSRLAELLEMMPVGVVVVDARTGRLLIGGGAIAALTGEDRTDTNAKQLERYGGYWPGTDVELRLMDWPLNRTLRTGEALRDVEADVRRIDGSRVTVTMSTTPVLDADGNVMAVAMVFQDVTERAANLRRLEQALAAEREARAAAEQASAVLEALQQLTGAFAAVTSMAQLSEVLLGLVRESAGASQVWLGVVRQTEVQVLVSSIDSFPPMTKLSLDTPVPGVAAIRSGAPQWSDPGEALVRWPMVRAFTPDLNDAIAALPLRHGAETFGCVVLRWAPPFQFDAQLRTMLMALAEVISQATQRVQLLEHERAVARALQESMLLQRLPVLDDVELAASYQPASEELEVGGDWYDVLPLKDGRIGVAVGDVMGRGLTAATAMGQLRSALAALALSFDDPADVLERLDAFAVRVDGAWLASVFYGVVDPVARTLRYCSAGHVPPLIAQPGAAAQVIWDGRSGLLGAPDPGARVSADQALPPGSVLVLYTDGLVERRGSDIAADCEHLGVKLAQRLRDQPAESLEDLCADLVATAPSHSDDVALLTLRLAAGDHVPSFHGDANGALELAALRAEMRRWLAQIELTEDERYDVLLAVGEACANAVEHAYGAGDGPVEVTGVVGRTALQVTITDRGTWIGPPSESQRGQGLLIMRALMDDVAVRATGSGTIVTLGRRLRAAVEPEAPVEPRAEQ